MKAEVKEKWLTALRSGDYAQGGGVLRKRYTDGQDEFCCLGVLCDLAVKEGVIPAPSARSVGSYSEYTYGDITGSKYDDNRGDYYSEIILPIAVKEWAGLDRDNPEVEIEGMAPQAVSDINDGGATFNEIADLIESQL